VDMEGYIATMDSQTEELISQLKVHMASGEKASSNGNTSGGDTAEPPSGRKPGLNDSKKRRWDEFLVTNKSGLEQHDRRPNKRRHGNEGRTRRNNRNRHGNKGVGNRNPGQDTPMTGTLITEPLQSLAHRSVHPLPPKPTTGPPPPLPSSSEI